MSPARRSRTAAGWPGLHDPVAGRSCRTADRRAGQGGEWQDVDAPDHGLTVAQDYDELERMLEGAQDDVLAMLLAEIEDLCDRAAVGTLDFDGRTGANEGGDVAQMSKDPRVLELRVPAKPYGLARLQTRLYFTEPRGSTRVLLMLHVNAKQYGGGSLWKPQQNAHIDTAGRRLDHHQWP